MRTKARLPTRSRPRRRERPPLRRSARATGGASHSSRPEKLDPPDVGKAAGAPTFPHVALNPWAVGPGQPPPTTIARIPLPIATFAAIARPSGGCAAGGRALLQL